MAADEGFDEEAWASLSALAESFEPVALRLVRSLLDEDGVTVHKLEYRPKKRPSVERKIATKSLARPYQLSDLTDVAGLRIITFYERQVDEVAAIIAREFTVDDENSVDKRAALDPDRFGYTSLHYVARLSKARRRLSEYKSFANLKFEIQIRSILQHAWAEIEHDLGYKANIEIPREVRRRFFRLASLLELADAEFGAIREDLSRYSEQVAAAIRSNDLEIAINNDSLQAYLESSALVRAMDDTIARLYGESEIVDAPERDISLYTAALSLLEIDTIEKLDSGLRADGEGVARFANAYIELMHPMHAFLSRGVSLHYYFPYRACELDDATATRLFGLVGFPLSKDEALALRGS